MRGAQGERGQAMVYMALVLAVMVGVLYATYDLARLTTAKIQAQNAADAAALAAVSVKVSVHNTRTLAHGAMTGQATLARLKLAKAVAVLGQYPLPAGGGAWAGRGEFDKYMDQAGKHMKKFRKLREGLRLYNQWIARKGPDIVSDAARVAYAANIAGMNDDTGRGSAANQQNLHLLDGTRNLVENGGAFKSGQFVGGFNYVAESAGQTGASGKTFVGVEPLFVPLGSGLLGGSQPMPLPALAAAGPVPGKKLAQAEPGNGDMALGSFGMPWYSPRLFPSGQVHGYPHEILH